MLRWIGFLCRVLGAIAMIPGVLVIADAFQGQGDLWTATGLWWFQLHPGSLQVLQPAIERHVSVGLYEFVVQPLLEAPLLMVSAGFAIVLQTLGWALRRSR